MQELHKLHMSMPLFAHEIKVTISPFTFTRFASPKVNGAFKFGTSTFEQKEIKSLRPILIKIKIFNGATLSVLDQISHMEMNTKEFFTEKSQC